jgi:hypothetical protein
MQARGETLETLETLNVERLIFRRILDSLGGEE